MAKVLYGSGVTAIKGKIAGTVYQGTDVGPVGRRKVTPRNPRSTDQQSTRNAVEFCGRMWRLVPQVCRDEWNARAVPPRDGFHEYMSYNIPRVRTGLDVTLCYTPIYDQIFEQPYFADEFE